MHNVISFPHFKYNFCLILNFQSTFYRIIFCFLKSCRLCQQILVLHTPPHILLVNSLKFWQIFQFHASQYLHDDYDNTVIIQYVSLISLPF